MEVKSFRGCAVTTAMTESSSILKEFDWVRSREAEQSQLGGAAALHSPKVPQNRHRAHGSRAGVVIRACFLAFTGPREKKNTYKNTSLAAVPSKQLTVLSVLTSEVCQQRLIAI